jgi:cytochrome d ubiquinol oxidase subunit I
MLLAAYLTTAMCVAAAGAWYVLRKVHVHEGRVMLHWGLALAALLIPFQIVLGHLNGEYTEKYQPSKFTAIEGRWQTEQPARLILFAWPDPDNERNLLEISVPVLGSLVDDGNLTSREPGIVTIPKEDRPPIAIPFFGFRIMVGMGLVMLAVGWLGCFLRVIGRLETTRWFLWGTFLSFPSGFVAVISGWYVAEVGRQPWVVYGLLRTADAHTPTLTTGDVLTSLIGYVAVYAVIYSFGIFYLYRLLRDGPTEPEPEITGVTGNRPMAAAGSASTATGSMPRAGE